MDISRITRIYKRVPKKERSYTTKSHEPLSLKTLSVSGTSISSFSFFAVEEESRPRSWWKSRSEAGSGDGLDGHTLRN